MIILNQHIKSIVRLQKTTHAITPHYFAHINGPFINDVGYPINGSINPYKSYANFYVNHYQARSYKDYLQKIKRGNATTGRT